MSLASLLAVPMELADLLRLWVVVAIVAAALIALRGRKEFGRWGRLAGLYPAAPRGSGVRVWGDLVILGRTGLRNSTWLEIDDRHLHVYPVVPMGRLRPAFSVPLSEISFARDTWGVVPQPVVRMTFARAASEPLLLPHRVAERLVAASAGRLQPRI